MIILKVVLRRSDGLMPKQKFLLQVVVTTVFVIYILVVDPDCLVMLLPFTQGMYFDCKWITVPLVYFVVLGTVNGVNFTDGLDGLATGVTTMVAVFFTVVAIGTHAGIEPITAAVTGALLGFLMFNSHPAKVFMGDTGSLALGGFVAGTAYVLQIPILIPVFGFIYMVEVLSVIIQVTYFKKTGGKRFFKMAPIHHHFELCGWSETQIVALFTVVTALLCLICLLWIIKTDLNLEANMKLQNKKVLVFGTGISGIAAVKLLEDARAVPVLFEREHTVKRRRYSGKASGRKSYRDPSGRSDG